MLPIIWSFLQEVQFCTPDTFVCAHPLPVLPMLPFIKLGTRSSLDVRLFTADVLLQLQELHSELDVILEVVLRIERVLG
jgi:hypothetical protein